MFKLLLFRAERLRGLVFHAGNVVTVKDVIDVATSVVLYVKHSAFDNAPVL
jgi:hypothetical protein